MITACVAVRKGIRSDVTGALPAAITEEFGDVIDSVEEDKVKTEEYEIRPYLPAVDIVLNEPVEKDAFRTLLERLAEERECAYELRGWDVED